MKIKDLAFKKFIPAAKIEEKFLADADELLGDQKE